MPRRTNLDTGSADAARARARATTRRRKRSLAAFPLQGECSGCSFRNPDFFCGLSEDALKDFGALATAHAYPRGATLFVEGQHADGVYILCSGRAKLATYSPDGRSLIIRIAEPGELLGLSACTAGVRYEVSAQVITDCHVNFIRTADFLEFLGKHSGAALNAVKELSRAYQRAHSQICSLGLSASVSDKLARLLLEWCDRAGTNGGGAHIEMSYTHEEMAEMIGTTRETVTRLLKNFRTRELINIRRSELIIPDREKLAALIGSKQG